VAGSTTLFQIVTRGQNLQVFQILKYLRLYDSQEVLSQDSQRPGK